MYDELRDLESGNNGELNHYGSLAELIVPEMVIPEWFAPVTLDEFVEEFVDVYVRYNKEGYDGYIYLEDMVFMLTELGEYVERHSPFAHPLYELERVTLDEVISYYLAIARLLVLNRFGSLYWGIEK